MAIWLRERGSARPGLLRELVDAVVEWRSRQVGLDMGRIVRQVDPSLVDPVSGLPLAVDMHGFYAERFGIHFLQDLIDQLTPISQTQGAIALASAMGLEPWYVWAHVVPPRLERDPEDPLDLDVPRQAIWRMGDWAIGLQVIDVVGKVVFADLLDEAPVEPRATVWPILLALRHRLPHPLALSQPEQNEFVEAVARWDWHTVTDRFLIETLALAWVDRFGEPPRPPGFAARASAWRPLHLPDALDPADPVMEILVRHAIGALEGPSTSAPELLPPQELAAAWKRARDALGGLLETAYARQVARILGVPWATRTASAAASDEAAWRLLVLEGVLRESVGAVRAMVLDPDAWLEEYSPLPQAMNYWTWRGMAES
jgi:hypothetical protein